MSKKLYEESNISAIADAIRNKNGSSDSYKVSQMASAILAISPDSDLEPLSVNQNGTYHPSANKDGFSSVSVAVPNSYAAGDEGKVVKNGALASQTSRTISDNGTYDTTENNEVVVQVSGGGGSATLISKNITQNGIYLAANDNADGYSYVDVNVQGSGGSSGVYVGTTDPDSSIGSNGDYYYKRQTIYNVLGIIDDSQTTNRFTGQNKCGYTFVANENVPIYGFRLFHAPVSSGASVNYHFYLYDSNGQLIGEAISEEPITNASGKGWKEHVINMPITLEANEQYTITVETSSPVVGYLQPTGGVNLMPHDSRFTLLNGVYGQNNTIDSSTIYMADLITFAEAYYKVVNEFYKSNGQWTEL